MEWGVHEISASAEASNGRYAKVGKKASRTPSWHSGLSLAPRLRPRSDRGRSPVVRTSFVVSILLRRMAWTLHLTTFELVPKVDSRFEVPAHHHPVLSKLISIESHP